MTGELGVVERWLDAVDRRDGPALDRQEFLLTGRAVSSVVCRETF